MATTISTQDIVDAKRDIDDIGEAVNESVIVTPRYGAPFKSIPMTVAELQAAIEIAAAAGAGENGWTAQLIVDASGKTQQEINNILKTQSVNIKQFTNALTDFSLAYYNALEFCRINAVETIYVPDGVYYANNSVQYTLNKNIRMVFGTNVKIYQNAHNHLFDITQVGFSVEFVGSGVEIYPNWETAPSEEICALKFNGWSTKRNFTLSGVNVLANVSSGQRFTWAFHGLGLNYAGVRDCLLQAKNSAYFGSQLTTDTFTRAMGAEFTDVRCLASDIGVLVVNQGTLAAEGFKFSGGEVLADIGFRVIDNISAAYYPPLFTVDGTHINARLALDLNGISRVSVKADIQARVSSGNTASGLIELSGVQVFNFTGSNVSHSVVSGSSITDAKPIFHIKSHPLGKISAFFNLSSATYWLAAQNGKLISFESDSVYSGAIQVGGFSRGGFVGKIVDKSYVNKVVVAESLGYTNPEIEVQLAISTDATFSDGVLTLGKKPLTGGYYRIQPSVVPNNSTINQIVCDALKGKLVDILFESSKITLSHTANFLQPNGRSWMTGGLRSGIRAYMVNQNVSHVVTTSGVGCHIPITTVPTSTSQSGIHGQKIFDDGFVYEYLQGTGWVKYAAVTF